MHKILNNLFSLISQVYLSGRPNTWLRVWGEMVVAAALASYPRINLLSLGVTFIATSPLLWTAGYMLNDVTDIKLDYQHPYRKNRPITTGALPVKTALIIIVFLAIFSITIGYLVSFTVSVLLCCLAISQIFYTTPPIRLKERFGYDISINAVNSALRYLLGWFSQIPIHSFYISPLLLFISLKIILFLGHRIQNRTLEQKNIIRSTITVLSKRTIIYLMGVFFIFSAILCMYMFFAGVLPFQSIFSIIGIVPLAVFLIKYKTQFLSQEKTLHFRTILYLSYFLLSNIVAYTILIRSK